MCLKIGRCDMSKLSIKFKIMLWFTSALMVLVLVGYVLNYYVSSHVLDQTLKERLVTIVDANVEEIEYHNNELEKDNPHILTLSYGDGKIEIDDDFCDYYEGVCTALVDSDNNLLYGESPILLPDENIFKGGNIQTVEVKDQKYFVYEKKSGQAIGFAGMMEIAPNVYEDTGIAIGPAFVRKGYGRQILMALVNLAFEELGATKFVASCRSQNDASRQLQLACGFVYSHSEDRTDPRNGEPYVLEFYELENKEV